MPGSTQQERFIKTVVPYQMSMPEGRVTYANGNWVNEFECRDHQNNLRVAFKDFNGQLSKHRHQKQTRLVLKSSPYLSQI